MTDRIEAYTTIAKPVKYKNSDFIYYKLPPLINSYFILSKILTAHQGCEIVA